MKEKNALVLSVGGSPEPLVTCIINMCPDLVYFIHSIDTLKDAKKVIELSDFNKESKFKLVNDHENLQESFAKSREVITELKKENYNVLVDFTGGTKPMVSGLVLAAIGEDCKYSYVGTSSKEGRDKDSVGIVKNGFEVIKNQKDPYDTYAVIEFNQGMVFFNKYQFEAARENFKQAEAKLEDETLRKLSSLYIKIVDCYDAWDKFNIKLENTNNPWLQFHFKKEILDTIEKDNNLKEYFQENNVEFFNQLKINSEFLNKKISTKNKKINKNILFYLPDLLNNVKRRIEEGKYDDAVARLYRTIELIGQLKLHKLGLIDKDKLKNFVFHIDKNNFMNKYPNYNYILEDDDLNDRFFSERSSFKLGLYEDYNFLKQLNEDLGKKYIGDMELQYDVRKRNNSILAHGLKPIDKKTADNLYKSTLNYSKYICPNIESYIKESKFPKFNI